ncbi:MAG: inorganic phosphate transporter [Oscillospiraceae bacterium]|nr:inorganic phosphate transporter [Oscillospiraceae bacterium]
MGNGLAALALVTVTAVIFVNGWTDAPNAIVNAVTTGSLSYRRAAALAAACNLTGTLVFSLLLPRVALTVADLVRFEGALPCEGMLALCGGFLGVILFSVAAWWFGIPTSESHGLVAGLVGAGLGLSRPPDMEILALVLAGLALSLMGGFLAGWALQRALGRALSRAGGQKLDRLQAWGAAGMAFMHGGQDGQKFTAVLCMVLSMAGGGKLSGGRYALAALFCSGVIAVGTALGGGRIIRRVGAAAPVGKGQGVAADLGSAAALAGLTLLGVPVSTTHTKPAALAGSCAAGSRGAVGVRSLLEMAGVWLLTFPACGLISFCLTRLFLFLL